MSAIATTDIKAATEYSKIDLLGRYSGLMKARKIQDTKPISTTALKKKFFPTTYGKNKVSVTIKTTSGIKKILANTIPLRILSNVIVMYYNMMIIIDKLKKKFSKLLSSTEKYSNIDMTYLVNGAFWLIMAKGIASISAFAVTILLTNLLPKEIFGQYRFVLSMLPILLIFTLPGIGTAVTRTVARGARIDLQTIVKTKIKWGFLGSLATLSTALYYFHKGNELIAYIFIISAVFIPFFENFFIYSFYYRGKLDFKTPAIYESISKIIQALLLAGTAWLSQNIIILIVVFFIGQILSQYYFYKKTTYSVITDANDNQSTAKAIRYGKHLTLLGVLGSLAVNIDKLFIWHFFGAEKLAIYVVAMTIPLTMTRTLNIIPELIFPKMSRKLGADTSFTVIKILGVTLSFATIISILYVLAAPTIFSFIFPRYTESVQLTQALSLIIPLFLASSLSWYALVSKNAKRMMNILIPCAIITELVLLFTLYSSLGIYAVILALCSYHITITIGTIIYFINIHAHARQKT